MNKSMIIGITLAVALIGGFALMGGGATAQGSRSSGNASAPAARMDACPYYPSPVVCRVRSTDHAAS